MTQYLDLADHEEDVRIRRIGMEAAKGLKVAFIVDKSPPEKVERYIAKLLKLFPNVRVIKRFDGPVSGTVSVIVRGRIRK